VSAVHGNMSRQGTGPANLRIEAIIDNRLPQVCRQPWTGLW